jgi:beta-lactamase superfamily II metal-dependent hydrolase
MSMDLVVFDVGRGLCVAVRTPNNYLCVIDCGSSESFSPILWLAQRRWTPFKGFRLAELIITHPHVDHIADIDKVTTLLKPYLLQRRIDLAWHKVISGGSATTSAIKHYVRYYMPPEYTGNVTPANTPNWGDGFELIPYQLDIGTVAEISRTDSEYVNNSSYLIVIKYKNYCFAIGGDQHSNALEALVKENQGLRSAIGPGVDFYITPHHGHKSGFCPYWFKIAGATRKFNIASEKLKGVEEDEASTAVDNRYSQNDYSKGENPEGKRRVTTKMDGHITISIADDGKWSWDKSK